MPTKKRLATGRAKPVAGKPGRHTLIGFQSQEEDRPDRRVRPAPRSAD